MSKKLKVTIAAIILLAGVVTLIFYLTKQKSKLKFQLIEHVSEKDIAYHTNFTEFLDEVIRYNSKVEKIITNNIALNELKSTLLKSGLKLEHTYITYSWSNEKYASVYAEIIDTTQFEEAFTKFSEFLNLRLLRGDSNLYISGNTAISAEKHSKYIKLNFGDGALNALSDSKNKSSDFFRKLLAKPNLGIVNNTGTTTLDSTDYATFYYTFTEDLNFTLDWKVTKNHPLRLNSNTTIPVYPSQKNNVNVAVGLDLDYLILNLNPYLKEKGQSVIDKLPPALQQLLELWNGQASLELGGKSVHETIQYVTEFDDDFNQVETKIVKVDSIPDVGIYWGSAQPKESLELIYKLPNVKPDKDKLQIALLPALFTKLDEKSVKASSQMSDYQKTRFNQLLQLNVDIPGIIGEINAEKTSTDNLRVTIKLKDWQGLRNPKKIDISNFW